MEIQYSYIGRCPGEEKMVKDLIFKLVKYDYLGSEGKGRASDAIYRKRGNNN